MTKIAIFRHSSHNGCNGDSRRAWDVAKARGVAQIANDAGLGRESLYKALSTGAHPRYETVNAVLRALGVKFTVVVDHPQL